MLTGKGVSTVNRLWIGVLIVFAAIFLSDTAAATEVRQEEGLVLRAECYDNEEIPQDGSLSFVLWDEQYNILQTVVNLRQYAAFAPLYFETDGRYIYYISQEAGRDGSIAYDPVVYQIVVEVTEQIARVTEVGKVRGDWVGKAEVVGAMGPHGTARFQNLVREVPLWAEVPLTGYRNGVWLTVLLVSMMGLFFMVRIRKTS